MSVAKITGGRRVRGIGREAASVVKATVREALDDDLFGVYVTNFGRYGRTYGAIGAIIVLMIWFYITGFAVLLGGELAAVLEHRKREGRGRARTPDDTSDGPLRKSGSP